MIYSARWYRELRLGYVTPDNQMDESGTRSDAGSDYDIPSHASYIGSVVV
jgi:hypothetical protein